MGGDSTVKKSEQAFRTISEAATLLDLPQHVLRFWETKFPQLRPMKRGGGRRYYRPDDVTLLARIKGLLHDDGYTIKGVQKLLREGGASDLPESQPQSPIKNRADESEAIRQATASQTTGQTAPSGDSSAEMSLSEGEKGDVAAVLAELRDIRAMLDTPAA